MVNEREQKYLPNYEECSSDPAQGWIYTCLTYDLTKTFRSTEIQKTLEHLFSGANFHFGNPVQQFLTQRTGNYHMNITLVLIVCALGKRFQPQRRRVMQNQKLIGQFSHVQFLKQRNHEFIQKVIELKNELEIDEAHKHLLIPPSGQQFSAAHLCQGWFTVTPYCNSYLPVICDRLSRRFRYRGRFRGRGFIEYKKKKRFERKTCCCRF